MRTSILLLGRYAFTETIFITDPLGIKSYDPTSPNSLVVTFLLTLVIALLFYVLLDVIVPDAIEPPSMQIQCVNSFLSTIRIVVFSTVIEMPFIVTFVFLFIEVQHGVCPS